MQEIFKRTELLLGDMVMERLAASRVIIFGVGGVGSWCAESLVRSGITQMTIVDFDHICVTNVNRQLMATSKTVGKVKVDVLRDRLLEINPKANITALQKIYCAETKDDFAIETYDYIIDAIDSLQNKVLLIQEATRTAATLFSSMGAALKIDAAKIQVAEFWKVKGCSLASALRQRFRKIAKDASTSHFDSSTPLTERSAQRPLSAPNSVLPAKKFLCIFSEERLDNKGVTNESNPTQKKQINGSLVHITAIFGFMLAGLVIESVNKLTSKQVNKN
jgi:tRNA A37 threonylcarbamoyladenosine dehydratase